MAEPTTVTFDGRTGCTLQLYVQGCWTDASAQPLHTVPRAQALADGEAEVQLLEGVRYEYALTNPAYRLGLDRDYSARQGIVLPSHIREHCGVLNPGLATGLLPLVLLDAAGGVQGRAGVEVRSRKLGYKVDYQQMMGDIFQRCVGLLQELRAPSAFKAEPDPGNAPSTIGQRFAFVRALLQSPDFENALHRINTHPHQRWQHTPEDRPTARGFKPTGKLQRQLVQGGRRVAVPVTHPLHATLATLPERLTVSRATLTEDTPENRFVKFALRGFHRFLTAMRAKVDATKDARLHQEITALCQRLDGALAGNVLRHCSEPTFLPLGSPTLQRKEGYREVLQAWLQFAMAAKLVWAGGDKVYGAGQRDVATLYEYWVFFALLKIVADTFVLKEPQTDALLEPTADGFGLKLKAGKYLALTGQSRQAGRSLEVRFSYNRSFKATAQPRAAGSWTQTLRPDYTLSLWPVGFTEEEAEQQELMVHVHFDAKYRLEQVADLLGDMPPEADAGDDALAAALDLEKQDESRGSYKRADLLKMHAYRDAIRRTQGAYVVYPGQSDAAQRLQGFHEVLPGLGAFALRPGSGTGALAAFLQDVVLHVSDRASAREQHSFHTYQTYEAPTARTAQEHRAVYRVVREKAAGVRAAPPRETFVLVGWVKGAQHLQWIETMGKYNFRMGASKGALRLSAQVVGASYLLLHGADGQAVPGLFRIKRPEAGPTVHSAAELAAMKYPTMPSQPAYLVYEVEPADEFEGYGWDYLALPGKPDAAAQGHPFATDLHTLLLACKPRLL